MNERVDMRTEEEVIVANKKLFKKIGLVVLGLFAVLLIIGLAVDGEPTDGVETKKDEIGIDTKVEQALDNLGEEMKSSIAATSAGGTQGTVEKVEADGKDGVKVYVSTYYTEPGDEGGRNIAKKIMANICIEVPELKSVYVNSTSSGLDSQSVYRDDIPGCKLN